MRFEKAITIQTAPYETLRLVVSDAESFEDCDRELYQQALSIDNFVVEKVRMVLAKAVN